jgi:hypothetical protein
MILLGIITSGILGGFSGKVGPVVGGSWKGISYMRQLPASVANPRTALQTAQRSKLSYCVAFAKAILSGIIKPLNDRFAHRQSGYNRFVSMNIALFAAAVPSLASALRLSEGSLLDAAALGLVVTAADPDVRFSWTDNSGTGNAQTTDGVYMVCMNATTGVIGSISDVDDRSDSNTIATMSEDNESGDVIHAWLAFRSANGFSASDTVYLTATVA